jgi:hypothetical protein
LLASGLADRGNTPFLEGVLPTETNLSSGGAGCNSRDASNGVLSADQGAIKKQVCVCAVNKLGSCTRCVVIDSKVEFGVSGKSVTLSVAVPKIDPLGHSFEV